MIAMNSVVFAVTLFSLTLLAPTVNAQGFVPEPPPPPTLRSAVKTWVLPFGKVENGQVVAGVFYDITQAVGEAMRLPVTYLDLPRKRLDAMAITGEYDLHCYYSPAWSDAPQAYLWSEPLFELPDVIVGTAGTPEPKRLADIPPDALVSAVLGYKYPTLDPVFYSGKLRREDTADQQKVLLKLSAGRTAYGVSNAVTFDWYRRNTPNHNLANWQLKIDNSTIHCAVPKASPLNATKIIEALNSLKKSGRIDAILRNYR
jgi:polar amino acid transport system substrate-binding protein